MERMTTSHANSEARVTTQYWGYRELSADEVETVHGGGDGADYVSYGFTPSIPSTINPTYAGQPRTPDIANTVTPSTGTPSGPCTVAANALGSGIGNRLGGFWGGVVGSLAGTLAAEIGCPRSDGGAGGGSYGKDTTTAGDASDSNCA